MAMAMMQIRPVRMGVRHGGVIVPMRVLHGRVQPLVIMRVMLVVMPVAMGMTQGGVGVRVGVAFDEQQGDPDHEQQRRHIMQPL